MIDYGDIMTKAEGLRIRLGEDNHSPIDIFSLVYSIEGLTLVYYPMGNRISGMCIKGNGGRCTIAINSSMTLGRQRFSLAHELYHLFYDSNMTSICAKAIGVGSETERKADAFAACFLMPRYALTEKADNLLKKHTGDLNINDIICIEQYFGVSHQTAIYQLNNCRYISKENLNLFMNISVCKQAEAMGYSADLYRPFRKENMYCTYGHYIILANKLMNCGIISNGKYEELLLEAFRDDLVYGNDEGGELID